MRQHNINGIGGSAPGRRATSTELPGRADLEGVLPGPVRSQGRVIQNWSHVLGATRLESAREQWRGAPDSYAVGRHAPDQARDMATELAGWTSGEFPGPVTDRLAAWPPGPQTAPDQPPASA